MSDSALNYFCSSGTAAEMAAHTPSPPTPAAGPDYGVRWFQTDTGDTYEWDGAVWVLASGTGTGTVTHTGTLASGAIVKGNGGVDVSTTTTGTGILTALGNNIGSAGAPVVFNGALGTPSSGTLTNCTGLPVAGGGTGAGTLTGVLKGNGTSAFTAAVASTDYLAPAAWMVCGRLTTESGVPVSPSDRTAQSTIYWTPYNGDTVPLYTGAAWIRLAFAEISLALSGLTSGKNYDVFVYSNAGTLTLELSAAWTNDTTRADAIVLQNGLYVKSGAPTRLLIGTIRTTNTTTTEDSNAKRFVWNAYNRVTRSMVVIEATDSWNYTTATLRQANANTANQLAYVVGVSDDIVEADVYAMMQNTTAGTLATVGVGVDSTSANSAQVHGNNSGGTGGIVMVQFAKYLGVPGLGYHFLAWLELSAATGTATWFGDAGNAAYQSGITGRLRN